MESQCGMAAGGRTLRSPAGSLAGRIPLGGVGVTALIFTLGANSLLADVIAGIFILFEGDITVGDIITIDGFYGQVTDISIRTTKLMDNISRDIKIINNSLVRNLINQSRKESCVLIDLPVSHDFGPVRAEQILQERLPALPSRYPEIIGEPEYLGAVSLPDLNHTGQVIMSFKVRVRFRCLEKNRIRLSYQLHRELVQVANILLNDHSEAGPADVQIVSEPPFSNPAP